MQRQEKGVASTMVAIDADGDPRRIIGFFCIIPHEFRGEELPNPWRKFTDVGKLKAVPGLLLAQLGVHKDCQHQGIGTFLVTQVFRRAIALVEAVGCAAIVADPIDANAIKLYTGFDFQPLSDGTARMIVPMKTVADAIARIDALV
jgi:ribosomal protein S18 acetylase RimI-like enzyme